MVNLVAVIFIFALRLWIWKFFPSLESGIKDDLSNMIIASCIFVLAVFFFSRKMFRRETCVKSGLEAPLTLFLAAAALSLGWSVDQGASVKALVMLLAYVIYFYILLEVFAGAKRRRAFLWAFFAGGLVVAALGVNDIIILNHTPAATIEAARLTNRSLYYILTHKRACSLFGWPNVLVAFLMLVMPLAVAFFMSVKAVAGKVLVALAGLVCVAAFFYTFSFLGWSIFLACSAFMFIVLARTGVVHVKPAMLRAGSVAVVLIALLFFGVIHKKNFGESMTPRKEYWRVVCSVIGEHPFTGTGIGTYRYASTRYVTSLEGLTAFPHNSYAQIWAETGLAGLAGMLWLIALLILLAWEKLRHLRDEKEMWFLIAAIWGIGAFLVENINSFTMLKPNISFFFWTWLAVFCSYARREEPFAFWVKARPFVMAAFLAAAIMGLFLSMRTGVSLVALRAGNDLANAGKFNPARQLYARARVLDPLSVNILTAQGNLYFRAFNATRQSGWLDHTEQAFVQASDLSPSFYYNFLALSSVHAIRGDAAGAKSYYRRALELSPFEAERDTAIFFQQKQ